ncbi:MAG: hypothetical protein E7514_04285 [Ruminococcaceae bacterium]|nr:hypothetical protein [Oscillospiraceae bacterium]
MKVLFEMSCRILVFGNDKRFEYVREYLCSAGFSADAVGVDGTAEMKDYSVFVLPLPVTRDGICINGFPAITLDGFASLLKSGDTVLGGMIKDRFLHLLESRGVNCFDYYDDELILGNARLTASAVLKLLKDENLTLNGKKCLVTGFGKCAKELCRLLADKNTDLTVTARSEQAESDAKSKGVEFVKLKDFTEETGHFDLVFNTVPALIFNEKNLAAVKDGVFIDIASAPYGVTASDAERFGIKLIRAASLPGRYEPESAGKLTGRRIIKYLKEGR